MTLDSILKRSARKAKLALVGATLGLSALLGGCGGSSEDPGQPVGRTPVFTPAGDETINGQEGRFSSYAVNITDAQNDLVSVTPSGLPSWLVWDAGTKTASGTADFTQAGIYFGSITAMDAEGNFAIKNVTFNIANVNRAPVISVIGGTTCLEGDVITLNFNATQLPGDTPEPIILGVLNAPATSTFNTVTRDFEWFTNNADGDGAGGFKLQNMTVEATGITSGMTSTIPLDLRVNDDANPKRILANTGVYTFVSMLPDGTDIREAGKTGEIGVRPRFFPTNQNQMTSNKLIGTSQAVYQEDIVGGTNQKLVSGTSTTSSGAGAAVSPDGALVAHENNSTGYNAIHLWNISSGTPVYVRKLTTNTNVEGLPVFKDANTLRYHAKKGSNYAICDSTTSGVETIVLQTSGKDLLGPEISPDGTRMTFYENDGTNLLQICESSIDGTNKKYVTSTLGDSGDVSGYIRPTFLSDNKIICVDYSKTGSTVTKGDLTIFYRNALGNFDKSKTITTSGIYLNPNGQR